MAVLIRLQIGNRKRTCNASCHNAKGLVCRCICRSAYHGAARNGTLNQKVLENQEKLLNQLKEEGKVLSAVLPLP